MNINPIVLSIPVFFILIGIELLVERFTHQKLYRLPDAISNISCGITSQLSGLFLKIFGIGIYQFLFEKFALFSLDNGTWWYWQTLILFVDLAYYWAHRMSHEINFITLLITLTVVNCGVLFEQRKWVKWAEWARIFSCPLLLSVLTFAFELELSYHGISLVYFAISFLWFYSLQCNHEHLQVV